VALQQHDGTEPSFLDRWIAEQGGDDAIAVLADNIDRGVAEGALPVFDDRESFLAYYRRSRRPV
jgi:hypothetical protein